MFLADPESCEIASQVMKYRRTNVATNGTRPYGFVAGITTRNRGDEGCDVRHRFSHLREKTSGNWSGLGNRIQGGLDRGQVPI